MTDMHRPKKTRFSLWLILTSTGLMLSGCALFFDYIDYSKTGCPTGTKLVSSRSAEVHACVDVYETSNRQPAQSAGLKPLGYMSYYDCKKVCAQQGKRLLSNLEWQEACRGTRPRHCNRNRKHPVLRQKQQQHWVVGKVDCKDEKNMWSTACLNDPNINKLSSGLARNKDFSRCISQYGIRHMVGNLGEWVADLDENDDGKTLGRFNGGLYPQPRSSCGYKTVQHGPYYRDYSIGCRCGQDPF